MYIIMPFENSDMERIRFLHGVFWTDEECTWEKAQIYWNITDGETYTYAEKRACIIGLKGSMEEKRKAYLPNDNSSDESNGPDIA
mgnify:CR=1 FL=1